MRQPPSTARRRAVAGQATAEMAIGLVGVMVAFVGLLQICALGFANITTAQRARASADAALELGVPAEPLNRAVSSWTVGADGLRHTADDGAVLISDEDLDGFTAELAAGPIILDDFTPETYGIHNHVSPALETGSLSVSLNLVSGSDSDAVSLDAALRALLFLRDRSVTLRDQAYMPSLKIMDPDALPPAGTLGP